MNTPDPKTETPAEPPLLLRGLRAIESGLSWLFAYPLIPLQVLAFWLISWGRLGYVAGVDDLFWSESVREQVFNGLTCGLLFAELLLVRYLLDPNRERFAFRFTLLPVKAPAVRKLGEYLLLLWVPALLVLGGFKLFSHDVHTGNVRVWPLYFGLVLSLAVGSGLIGLAGRLRPAPASADAGPEGTPDPRTRDKPLHRIAATTAALYLVGLGIVYVRHVSGAELSPVVVLCVILGLLNAVYGFVAYRAPGLQHVVFIVLIVTGIAANARWANPYADYKLTLPGLEEYYDAPLVLEEDAPDAQGKSKRLDHYYDLLQRQANGQSPKPDLIPSEEPLRKMRERWQAVHGKESKPRIVLVSTSGGGIRAAVWTAVVLEGLERELDPAFRGHIRMFTGASGGMVGAGLYVAEFEDTPAGKRDFDPETGLGGLSGELAQDSLRRTVQTMLLSDVPSVWLPGRVNWDRGRELERVWAEKTPRPNGQASGFRRPFSELAPLERDGLRPSLVFSPMMVEDARRLLISNLDLMPLTVASGPVVNFKPDEASGRHPFPGAPERPLLSLSGVELFRLFPGARAKFQMGTAARVNASFPYLSPGVSLPTYPPRRLVDAGYYDNYGVNLAAVWLANNQQAIRDNTSGVVLIEIRAYRNGYARWHFQDDEAERKYPGGKPGTDEDKSGQRRRRDRGAVEATLEGLSTPAEAIANMRARAAYYRNDELLDWLDREFNGAYEKGRPKGKPGGAEFFTTVAFECEVDAALSWTLPRGEATVVAESFYSEPANRKMRPWIQSRVESLKVWFGSGGR